MTAGMATTGAGSPRPCRPGSRLTWARSFPIGRVCLSNDQEGIFTDRAASNLRILTAVEHDPPGTRWKTVIDHLDTPLEASRTFSFDPVQRRRVRVEVAGSNQGEVRFDEIEIYEAKPVSSRGGIGLREPGPQRPRAACRIRTPVPSSAWAHGSSCPRRKSVCWTVARRERSS